LIYHLAATVGVKNVIDKPLETVIYDTVGTSIVLKYASAKGIKVIITSTSEVYGKSKKYPFKPILMKRNLTREELAVVETNLFNLAGVMIQVSPQRSYNYEQLASHLIGYLGEISDNDIKNKKYPDNKQGDFIGKYGVEGRWQRFLTSGCSSILSSDMVFAYSTTCLK